MNIVRMVVPYLSRRRVSLALDRHQWHGPESAHRRAGSLMCSVEPMWLRSRPAAPRRCWCVALPERDSLAACRFPWGDVIIGIDGDPVCLRTCLSMWRSAPGRGRTRCTAMGANRDQRRAGATPGATTVDARLSLEWRAVNILRKMEAGKGRVPVSR